MGHQPSDISRAFRLTTSDSLQTWAWLADCRPIPLIVAFRYDSRDPWAVCLVLNAGASNAVEWYFARDLLANGLSRKAGLGDVQVQPESVAGAHVVRVTIRGRGGHFHVRIPARDVLSFVKRTEAMVGFGTEHQHLPIDDIVRRLTDTDGRTLP